MKSLSSFVKQHFNYKINLLFQLSEVFGTGGLVIENFVILEQGASKNTSDINFSSERSRCPRGREARGQGVWETLLDSNSGYRRGITRTGDWAAPHVRHFPGPTGEQD